MPQHRQLTTEHIRSLFFNNFKLANYAIRMARFYVKAGHEVSAEQILKEVAKHPDESYIETLKQLEEEDAEAAPFDEESKQRGE